MPEWLVQSIHAENAIEFRDLVTRLLVAFMLGWVVAGVHYLASGRVTGRVDRSFLATLVLLSLLICLVAIVIGNNTARAFSLVGALAIVRFRTVVEDTRDTVFVIFSVIAGMAAGTGYAEGPIVCAPLVLLAAWLFRPQRKGPGKSEGTLVLRMGAGRSPGDELHAELKKHLGNFHMVGLETARGGAALDLTYSITVPPPEKALALVAALGKIEGVQSVELKER